MCPLYSDQDIERERPILGESSKAVDKPDKTEETAICMNFSISCRFAGGLFAHSALAHFQRKIFSAFRLFLAYFFRSRRWASRSMRLFERISEDSKAKG